jgi:hypothetical protein
MKGMGDIITPLPRFTVALNTQAVEMYKYLQTQFEIDLLYNKKIYIKGPSP